MTLAPLPWKMRTPMLARNSHEGARFWPDIVDDIFVSARRRPDGVDSCALLDLASRCLAQNTLLLLPREEDARNSAENRKVRRRAALPHEKCG